MDHNTGYWDNVARITPLGQDYDPLLAEHYRCAHLSLFSRWGAFSTPKAVLKTDLFAEAICPSRSFAWEVIKGCGNITGVDVSPEICRKAKLTSTEFCPAQTTAFAVCDLRKLPFANGYFDLIISDSTLDHYKNKNDIEIALHELTRVLKPGGTLIVTMDNPTNFTEPLFRLWIRLGLSPFFIGRTYSLKELKAVLSRLGLEIMDGRYLIHNPRFITKLMIAFFRRVFPHQSTRWTKRAFRFFDGLDNLPTRSITAQFIAVKAVKPPP